LKQVNLTNTTKQWDVTEEATYIAKALQGLGIDLSDPNFCDTPMRVAKHLFEFTKPKDEIEKDIKQFTAAKFPATNREMVMVSGIRIASLCPHHLVSILYDVNIGYIPEKFVVGLSKLARIAEELAKHPFLQETYTELLATTVFEKLECLGSIVVVKGLHMCMVGRGVKQNAVTTTSSLKGVFMNESHAKMEFLELLKISKDWSF